MKRRLSHILFLVGTLFVLTPAVSNSEDAPRKLEFIRVSDDGKHFVGATTGQRFVAWGVNYDHDDAGRLLEDYWDKEWDTVEQDFREIKALGANVVRIHLQVAKFMETAEQPNDANLARLGKLL
ncbi:MAG TPA: hypothetical protein VHB77_23255, partial [Planctomycetaceae bacterium]|nr:hypothetical protein [Planctomycetaceae bacterium]